MGHKNNMWILILAFSLMFPLASWADGVVFATEEDLAAFDQLVVKSQKTTSGTENAKEKTSANFQRVRDKLNSLIEKEKAKGAAEAKGKSPVFGDSGSPGNGKAKGASSSSSSRGQGKFPDGSPGKGKGKNK
ncbi:MAG: hypothetical protein KDD43_03930 [Bdellovibrionales bacterium]|nr:hypothetical protein [Bdellovibrionales bacterium]